MMLTRRHFLFTAAALPFIPGAAQALTAAPEYLPVQTPLKTLDPKRIEVMEFFWYGCPHCFALEPDLNAWLKTLPKNAYLRRVPAVFPQTPHWIPLARAYYAAEMLGLSEKLHYDIFNGIHLSGQNLNDKETLLNFVQKLGVNRKQFAHALESPRSAGAEAERRCRDPRRAGICGGWKVSNLSDSNRQSGKAFCYPQ
jgi:thiol:disulfide interchange protein DsbA